MTNSITVMLHIIIIIIINVDYYDCNKNGDNDDDYGRQWMADEKSPLPTQEDDFDE